MVYKNYRRLCFLDTETTGVYWNCSFPLQVAAIIYDDKGNFIDSFNEKIKTMGKIPASASEVNHIYAEDLVNCRTEREVLVDFIQWLRDNKVDCFVTYNGDVFDLPLLTRRCQVLKIGEGAVFDFGSVSHLEHVDCKKDVFTARSKNILGLKALGRGWKLTKVSEILGIDTVGAHDALKDVEMLKEVFFKLDPLLYPNNWVDPGELKFNLSSLF